MSRSALAWSAALSLLLAPASGCDDDTSTSGTGGGPGGSTSTGGSGGSAGSVTAQQYCEGKIARLEQCGEALPTLQECLDDSNTRCMFDTVRPEIIAALVSCLNSRPCGQSDDECYHSIGAASPTAAQEAYIAACLAKHEACEGGSTFAMDYCGLTVATTATYEQRMPCFELACDQVRDCLRGAMPASCQ